MLPYQTLQEAEIYLGRNLTFAETLWFKYSARKSDYVLHFHNTLLVLIFYTLSPIPFAMIELLRSEKTDKFKIQPKFRTSFYEMIQCYKKVVLTYAFPVAPLNLLSYPIIQWVGIRTSLPLPSGAEIFWQLMVYLVMEDYINYWLHRLLHTKWGYEKIHRVHHEYTAPFGYAGPYAHWVEIAAFGGASFLGPLMVPCHMIVLWVYFTLGQLEAIETHSGYEFPWSPTKLIPFYGGAGYHDYHHYVGRRCQSNLGTKFTYCDYIYGTDKGYRYVKNIFEKNRENLKGQNENKSD